MKVIGYISPEKVHFRYRENDQQVDVLTLEERILCFAVDMDWK